MNQAKDNKNAIVVEKKTHAPWMEIVVLVLVSTKQMLSNQIEKCIISEWLLDLSRYDMENIAVHWRIEKQRKSNQHGSQSMCGL